MENEQQKQLVSKALDDYATIVFRIAFVHLKNYADAEDVVQEVFFKLYKTNTQFADSEHLKAWLLRVTINHCKSIQCSFWNKHVYTTDDVVASITDESKRNVVTAVLELPEKYRDVIYMFYYEGYSTAEIARLLNQKEPTVRTRLKRGRELLKTYFKGGLFDEI